jgi:hypothetical protein
MNPTELASLTAAGAGSAAPRNADGSFAAGATAKQVWGYDRRVNPDGTVTLTAYTVDGVNVSVTV